MFPEDRVLVGVVNRKRDFLHAREEHWYRIPQSRMPKGVNADYLALFTSGRAFKEQSGGIHYYARITGLELAYRRELLPDEADHPRTSDIYYKVALSSLQKREPPILNPSRRSVTFIHTTWDRFVRAETIADLYTSADYFVDRIYHALRNAGISSERLWKSDYWGAARSPGIKVLCENGALTALTEPGMDSFFLDETRTEDSILAAIMEEIRRRGGPAMINIPTEDF